MPILFAQQLNVPSSGSQADRETLAHKTIRDCMWVTSGTQPCGDSSLNIVGVSYRLCFLHQPHFTVNTGMERSGDFGFTQSGFRNYDLCSFFQMLSPMPIQREMGELEQPRKAWAGQHEGTIEER